MYRLTLISTSDQLAQVNSTQPGLSFHTVCQIFRFSTDSTKKRKPEKLKLRKSQLFFLYLPFFHTVSSFWILYIHFIYIYYLLSTIWNMEPGIQFNFKVDLCSLHLCTCFPSSIRLLSFGDGRKALPFHSHFLYTLHCIQSINWIRTDVWSLKQSINIYFTDILQASLEFI